MAQGGQAPAGFPEGLITWHKQSSRCTRKCGGCFLRGTILNALRVALRIISGKIILNFGTPERLRRLRCSIFTGGVVTKNGSCSAAFCESAALRSYPPSGSLRTPAPPRGRLMAMSETLPPLKPSPAGGRWRIAPDEGQHPLTLHALSGAPAPALPGGEPRSKARCQSIRFNEEVSGSALASPSGRGGIAQR